MRVRQGKKYTKLLLIILFTRHTNTAYDFDLFSAAKKINECLKMQVKQ